jgi:hypothetical protein
MNPWQWLKGVAKRADRATEDTALGMSATGTSGAGGANAAAVTAMLGEIEQAEQHNTDPEASDADR